MKFAIFIVMIHLNKKKKRKVFLHDVCSCVLCVTTIYKINKQKHFQPHTHYGNDGAIFLLPSLPLFA